MRKPMSLKARRELLMSARNRYQKGDRMEKQKILDEIVAVTGYHRKYVITVLKRKDQAQKRRSSSRKPRIYTEEVQKIIIKIWQASNQLCAKRLAPYLTEFVSILEQKGHLQLTDETRKKVVEISAATIDRIVASVRGRRGLTTTKKGTLIKHQIPIRTFNEWDDGRPGFLEADLVAHCGTTVSGSYLNTLTLTDVATGWTECFALLTKSQECVTQALDQGLAIFPFPILGLDTDNGSEFMNGELITFCKMRGITFTRSRPYKKNDQCYVEQKNGSVVRRLVGYDRFEGTAACRQLAEVHGIIRLHVNFFQPSMKLIGKHRIGGNRVKKTYDQAQTPYQRLLASAEIAPEIKSWLREQYAKLDPVEILSHLAKPQTSLWHYAWRTEVTPLETLDPGRKRIPEPVKLANEESSVQIWRSGPKTGRYHLVKHTWRTHPDPFVLVWDDLVTYLEGNPHQTAKELFQICQTRYPGQFSDGQLRTLQRRVKSWRREKLKEVPVLVQAQMASTENPPINFPNPPPDSSAEFSIAFAATERQGVAPASR